jgi:hypothetical protein
MPRQLPWVRAATKHRPQPAKSPVASDIDDDFFDGTLLATDKKSKGRALSPGGSSDTDDRHARNPRKKRALSSSPPAAEPSAPRTENMRTAVSRFDLRDDEWMMVEDDLLETAKLFTHHLRVEDYKIIEQGIEAKKKGIATNPAAVRHVVAGATLSAEGTLKEKVRVQSEKQRRAFRDVFTSRDEDDEHQASARTQVAERPSVIPASSDTDSDDLDAPLRPSRSVAQRPATLDPRSSTPPMSMPIGPQAAQRPRSAFVKPIPASRISAPRLKNSSGHRAMPFDMLDDYLPKANRSAAAAVTTEREEQTTPVTESLLPSSSNDKPPRRIDGKKRPRRSTQLLEEWDVGKADEGNEAINTQGRHTKEKSSGKRKAADAADDIPTFLL